MANLKEGGRTMDDNRFSVITNHIPRHRFRPPRRRFFLVSLCLQANVEMVPQFPSCYYMPLM